MAKFQKVGSGFVKHEETLLNLKAYKEIENVGVALWEGKEGGIKFTPLQPSKEDYENNIDGSSYVIYSKGEEQELEEDFKLIQEALAE